MLAPTATSTTSPSSGWLRFARRHTSYVGIDIGIDRVRIATLGMQRQKSSDLYASHSLAWKSNWSFSLPIDPASPPPANWVDQVVENLVDQLPRCVDGDRNVCVMSLPLPWIHYQTTPSTEIAEARQQCDAMFSSSLFQSSAHLSHWPVVESGDQLVIAATAEHAASRLADAVSSVGYRVELILPHGVALLRSAPSLTLLRPGAIAVLEHAGGMVAVAKDSECGLCRNLPGCNLPVGRQPYLDELERWLLDIASEIHATFRYASRLGGTVDPESPVLLCGGVAEIVGVDSFLATSLGRPVATWRYAGSSRPGRAAGGDDESVPVNDASLALSLSLAGCAFDLTDAPALEGSKS